MAASICRVRLANAYDNAQTSASAAYLTPWPELAAQAARAVTAAGEVLLVASWLLAILAVASVAVLVGGRMAEQTRRVGLLKAVGATPGTVAAVLLVEHVGLAVVAGALGLGAGRLAAPLLATPSAGLLGAASVPAVTAGTVAVVLGVAVAVAALATLVPALRAARTSTVSALADAARSPRRGARLIALSSRLPVPLLFGLRLASRRPRRALLGTLSIAVTAAGLVALVSVKSHLAHLPGSSVDNPAVDRVDEVMAVVTVMLFVLAALNALLITWTTVVDNRRASALARALGATPEQVTGGLSVAQMLCAVPARWPGRCWASGCTPQRTPVKLSSPRCGI